MTSIEDRMSIAPTERAFWQAHFARFTATHPPRHFEAGEQRWSYLSSGQGCETIVLLHSAAGGAESLFYQIGLLEADYRILAPTIPADVTTMPAAVAGVAALLDREQIATAHVVGHSIGGMLAQCFLWSHPQRVRGAVFSHTILPSPAHAAGLAQARGEYGSVPEAALFDAALELIEERHRRQPRPLTPVDWVANRVALEEIFRSGCVRKRQLLGWLALEEDYHRHASPPAEVAGEHALLIIESDSDEVYSLPEREALKQAYPRAQVHTFPGWGHLAIVASGPVIQAFLAAPDEAGRQPP